MVPLFSCSLLVLDNPISPIIEEKNFLTKINDLGGFYGKVFAYYGKNRMYGAGQSIYKSLGKAFLYSGAANFTMNTIKNIRERVNS